MINDYSVPNQADQWLLSIWLNNSKKPSCVLERIAGVLFIWQSNFKTLFPFGEYTSWGIWNTFCGLKVKRLKSRYVISFFSFTIDCNHWNVFFPFLNEFQLYNDFWAIFISVQRTVADLIVVYFTCLPYFLGHIIFGNTFKNSTL